MLGIFLDTETTGLDPFNHCVIDIAFKIVDLSCGQVKFDYQTIIKHSKETWEKRDPFSCLINGYTWEEVNKGKDPHIVAKEIISTFKKADVKRNNSVFICQNPSFDKGFFTQLIDVYTQENLDWPYHWLDLASMYWTQTMINIQKEFKPFPKEMILSKNAIAKSFGIVEEVEPHHAMGGVDHLISCYQAVIGIPIQEIAK